MLKKSDLIFSSVALQVPPPHGITLALDSVFSRPAWHSECVGLRISVQAEHHSLSEFLKRHSFLLCFLCFLFFYFQHCQYKTSARLFCHISNKKKKQTKHRNKLLLKTWTENCGFYWSSYVPTYSSVSAFNGPSKKRLRPVYLT